MSERLLTRDRVLKILTDNQGDVRITTNVKGLEGVLAVVVDGSVTESVHKIVRPEDEESLEALKKLRHDAAYSYFTKEKWQQAVVDGDTSLGYAEWVKKQTIA